MATAAWSPKAAKTRSPASNQARFEELEAKAKAGCPISKLLNADITLDATLLS